MLRGNVPVDTPINRNGAFYPYTRQHCSYDKFKTVRYQSLSGKSDDEKDDLS